MSHLHTSSPPQGEGAQSFYRDIGLIRSIFRVFPIATEVKEPFLRDVQRWLENNGPEWVVARLKSLYVDLVRLRAGLSHKSSWVKWDKVTNLPKGSLKPIFRLGLMGDERNFYLACCLLRCYTAFRGPISTPTKTQLQKFEGAVTAEPTACNSFDAMVVEAGKQVIPKFGLIRIPIPEPLVMFPLSPTRKAPGGANGSVPESESLIVSIREIKRPRNWAIVQEAPELIGSTLEGLNIEFHRVNPKSPCENPKFDVVGNIGFIQEPGYKLRAVANPNRIFQAAVTPLSQVLFRILRTLPWDCTHCQPRATRFVQNALSKGITVFSVDLSSATDLFPLSLQMTMLREMFAGYVGQDNVDAKSALQAVKLFEKLSTAYWKFPPGGKIAWSRGQPLGLKPSFPLFALTHGLLLYALNRFRHDDKFFVLGDDVVIISPDLNSRYREALNELGCVVSDTKSLTSSTLAEFAGKIITQYSSYPQIKYRDMSDDNFVDIVRLLGKRSMILCKRRQRRVLKALELVPEKFGGLGFNPLGVPLSEREFLYQEAHDLDEEILDNKSISLDRRIYRNLNLAVNPVGVNLTVYGNFPEPSKGRFVERKTILPSLASHPVSLTFTALDQRVNYAILKNSLDAKNSNAKVVPAGSSYNYGNLIQTVLPEIRDMLPYDEADMDRNRPTTLDVLLRKFRL